MRVIHNKKGFGYEMGQGNQETKNVRSEKFSLKEYIDPAARRSQTYAHPYGPCFKDLFLNFCEEGFNNKFVFPVDPKGYSKIFFGPWKSDQGSRSKTFFHLQDLLRGPLNVFFLGTSNDVPLQVFKQCLDFNFFRGRINLIRVATSQEKKLREQFYYLQESAIS